MAAATAAPAAAATVPLSEDDIEKLFSGAPQFFARSEGHCTGAPHPSVAFPFDEELHIRDLTDHVQIEDPAWGCVTAWPHITRGGCEPLLLRSVAGRVLIPSAPPPEEPKRRPHFYPRCRERPNMLSIHGLEKGTMGYQAALEFPVADALQEEQFGFERLGSRARAIVEARQSIANPLGPGLLRQLDESAVLDQLMINGARYREGRRPGPAELYAELFTRLLQPPARTLDHRDPHSLPVQIQALLKVLAVGNIWIDFSQVAWRIRLGQILWGDGGDGEKTGDDDEEKRSTGAIETVAERYWLLLQILVGCELLIRLDAVTEGEELGIQSIRASEVQRFEREANASIKWNLILARCWLDNIEVAREGQPAKENGEGKVEEKADTAESAETAETAESAAGKPKPPVPPTPPTWSSGWLASLAATISLSGGTSSPSQAKAQAQAPPPSPPPRGHDYVIRGRYDQRQVNGLLHFARKLRWPNVEALASRVLATTTTLTSAADPIPSPSPSPSPLGTAATAATATTSRTSYFGPATSSSARVDPLRQRGRQLATPLRPAGWLSRSYVSGLVLPGEGLAHFLMASLLESDADALVSLGPVANLCGGFVFAGMSFWSTACVVGRVLAAGRGATECMGWVSSDVVPAGVADRWVDVPVEGLEGEASRTGRRARLWDKARVERESSIVGNSGDDSPLRPVDLLIPVENGYSEPAPEIDIRLTSLNLDYSAAPGPTPSSEHTAATLPTPSIQSCPASITFSVSERYGDGVRQYEVALRKDVNFVTAHPCLPCRRVKILKTPHSPTLQGVDVSESGTAAAAKGMEEVTSHPIHKRYTYTVIHLSDLLDRYADESLDDLLRDGSEEADAATLPPSNQPAPPPRVLIVDCITGFAGRRRRRLGRRWLADDGSPPSPTPSSSVESRSLRSRRSGSASFSEDGTADSIMSPSSPVLRRGGDWTHNWPAELSSPPQQPTHPPARDNMMLLESRQRRFGSDMEVLVRALCAEKGWDALVSRRRRGCLGCAIREAGALGWRVVIRVE